LTDAAIDLLRQKDDRPFFLNLWHYAVHTPIQAKAEDIRRFKIKRKAMGLDRVQELAEGEFFPCEHKRHLRVVRRLVQSDPVYAAMIWNLDMNIGRLLAALEETGQADNTVVIFTSDNGGLSTAEGSPTSNAPLSEGKGWMYEGGVREPLFIRWPGVIAPGTHCTEPVTSTDFYPTLLEMAGLPLMPRQHTDGVSLMPLLRGQDTLQRHAIYWHYPHYGNQGGTPGASVRMGHYKLIEFYEDGRLELYHLEDDPGENHNLAKKMPELAERMRRMLADWRDRVNALIPQPNPDYCELKGPGSRPE